MDGMKRAAKMLIRGHGDLGAVVVDQKCLQEVCGKLIPSINNVSTALLKWSYTESNYTFPDVFSAWADLDAGFTQLLQGYLEECSRYRKSFKDIIAETKKVTDVQREKDRTAGKVATTSTKLENAKKAAKKNENNERAKTQVSNLEADLFMAKEKDDETEELLTTTLEEFELYKATMLKDSLTTHCHALMELLHKGTHLCKAKLEIAESMPDEPAAMPDAGLENSMKVEAIFNKFHLKLPLRDAALQRNLPVQTLPPPQASFPPKSPRISKQTSMPVHTSITSSFLKSLRTTTDIDSDDDYMIPNEDDYMIPNEDIHVVPESSVKNTPPDLPPRNDVDEEDYVVPMISPKPPLENKQQSAPPVETEADYFQVISDDDSIPASSNNRKTSNPQHYGPGKDAPAPVSEPVYTVPPDEEEDDNRLYGNMSNEELQQHQKTSIEPPVKPLPYARARKPAVYPKPAHQAKKETPARHRQDSASQDEQYAAEDENAIHKTE